jgi:predicted AlkP superfamily phosphohydrolase/phosphomutase
VVTVTGPRVVLVGLDGATFDILDPLMADGTMPHLAALMTRSAYARMRSTPHPLSPPAWASIITGRTPGEHGIFDFVRVDHSTGHPTYTLTSSMDLAVPTVFQLLSSQERTVTALNFPCTFPPPRVKGCVVPGYVPWSYLARACHPRELYSELRDRAGLEPRRLAVDWEVERTAVQGLDADQLLHWVELHLEREQQWAAMLFHLMNARPADLTAVVFDGVDRIQHLCLHLLLADPATLSPEALKTRDSALAYYRLVDGYVGELVSRCQTDNATLIVVSDHGSCPAGDRIFYANTWLAEHGYLRWRDGVPVDQDRRLALDGNTEVGTLFDWQHTTAAALTSSSNAVIVHRAAGHGAPGVAPEDLDAFCAQLREELLEATDPTTGEPLVTEVLLRDDAFAGPVSDRAPDLTLELASPGFLSVLRGSSATARRPHAYGTHHPEGIFVAAGPGVTPGPIAGPVSVTDVTPTVLALMSARGAHDLTGTVLPCVPAALDPGPPAPEPALVPVPTPEDHTLDRDAEAEVVAHLRLLGYLE